jgi:hypothetical protein
MKQFASEIYTAVKAGRLTEPFGPYDVKQACPGWADRTYANFLSKHRVGNPSHTSELFEQVGPGQFRTTKRPS